MIDENEKENDIDIIIDDDTDTKGDDDDTKDDDTDDDTDKIKVRDAEHDPITIYLCGTAFVYDIDPHNSSYVKIYASEKALKEDVSTCWKECGIVAAKLSFEKWTLVERLFNDERKLIKANDVNHLEKIRFEQKLADAIMSAIDKIDIDGKSADLYNTHWAFTRALAKIRKLILAKRKEGKNEQDHAAR